MCLLAKHLGDNLSYRILQRRLYRVPAHKVMNLHYKQRSHICKVEQMDIRKVKKLIELLEESNIGEIEVKEGDDTEGLAAPATSRCRLQRHRLHLYKMSKALTHNRLPSRANRHRRIYTMLKHRWSALSIDHLHPMPHLSWKSEPMSKKENRCAL